MEMVVLRRSLRRELVAALLSSPPSGSLSCALLASQESSRLGGAMNCGSCFPRPVQPDLTFQPPRIWDTAQANQQPWLSVTWSPLSPFLEGDNNIYPMFSSQKNCHRTTSYRR